MFDFDEKILLYPIDRENLSIIKSVENYQNIHIHRLVSFESWGHVGEYYIINGIKVDISYDFEKALDDCTTVWITNSWNEIDFTNYIQPAIHVANKKGKRIVCSRELSEKEKILISDIDLTYISHSSFMPITNRDSRVQEIRTPIISVMSSTEYCNQFYIETAIGAELRNQGYDVLLVTSRKEGVAFEANTIPDFMFSRNYNENEKVISLNQYIRYLETKKQPDVIIIGVPGAAMPYHHKYSSDFGILSYEISEAIKPDFVILSSPCMPYEKDFFLGIERDLYGRLGVTVDVHSLSPYALDLSESSMEKNLSYISVDDYYVQKTINKIAFDCLMNLNNTKGISGVVDRIINKLAGGAGTYIT